MYAHFDYRCTGTGEVVSKFVKKIDMDNQTCRCGEPMMKLPSATRTTFRYADTKLKG